MDNSYKVSLPVSQDDSGWPGFTTENVWAEKLTSDRYQIKNIPHFSDVTGLGDIISVRGDNSNLMYENLLESSGCSTIRFLLKDKGLKEKMNIEKSLRDIGVNDFEYANDLFGAMSVEPEVKYLPIRNLLDEYVQKGLLGYEEVLLRHQF